MSRFFFGGGGEVERVVLVEGLWRIRTRRDKGRKCLVLVSVAVSEPWVMGQQAGDAASFFFCWDCGGGSPRIWRCRWRRCAGREAGCTFETGLLLGHVRQSARVVHGLQRKRSRQQRRHAPVIDGTAGPEPKTARRKQEGVTLVGMMRHAQLPSMPVCGAEASPPTGQDNTHASGVCRHVAE